MGLIIVMRGAGIRGAPRVGERAQGGIVDKVEGESGVLLREEAAERRMDL